jgi:hypothetical protein
VRLSTVEHDVHNQAEFLYKEWRLTAILMKQAVILYNVNDSLGFKYLS